MPEIISISGLFSRELIHPELLIDHSIRAGGQQPALNVPHPFPNAV